MKKVLLTIVSIAALIAAACGGGDEGQARITIDGSSTVYPVTQAIAEEFLAEHPGLEITVGVSGTGGGFKKFCVGETNISDASRPIEEVEVATATENKVEYIELPIAFDGLSVVVNKNNDWVDYLTVDELKRIFGRENHASMWSDVREGWPQKPISIYAPDTDSGTYDYFNEAITGRGNHTGDYQPSADDNVLVRGVSDDTNAIGYFGYSYYIENKDSLKLVAVDNGNGPVAPSKETINNGSYSPLSRPIFIYVNVEATNTPIIEEFVKFYLHNASRMAEEVGYVGLPKEAYDLDMQRYEERKTGSVFNKRTEIKEKDITEILKMNR